MSPHDHRQLAERFIEALHQLEGGGTPDALLELFSAHADITNPQIEHRSHAVRGPEGVREFWDNYRMNFRDVRSEFTTVTSGPESAGLFWRSEGTDAQGKPFSYDGATLLLFDDEGKIRHMHGYFDSRALQHSAG